MKARLDSVKKEENKKWIMAFKIDIFPGFLYEIEISEQLAAYIEENPEDAEAYFLKEFNDAFTEWTNSIKTLYQDTE
jgi:hypothetical protein